MVGDFFGLGILCRRRDQLRHRPPAAKSTCIRGAGSMNRLVYTCPITGVVLLTDSFVQARFCQHAGALHFAIYCPACDEQHWTSIGKCRAYPVKEGGSLRAEAS